MDQDKKTEIVEKETWAQLNNLAQGKVIKEDVKLLKKTVKKKQALKRQNKEKWEQRTQALKIETEKKQQKRQENIQIKRDQQKKRKRAGF